jgi:uncharacterized protein (DUF697 family)/GTPase SAR1 family protein
MEEIRLVENGIMTAENFNLAELAKRALDEALRERGHVNVLVAGRTGVGKSTLVNAVFQGDLATTGHGRPVTTHTREITKEGVPLSIFDTRGLEMADCTAALRTLEAFIAARQQDRDANRRIHVAWVCVEEDLRRVEEAESALARALAAHVPVVGVITKARADRGFRTRVQELMPEAPNVVRVRALRDEFDDGHILEPMGLRELVELTMTLVPEGQRRAFVAAQKVDIELKKRHARMIVATAAASAAGIGAAPIPFADAALIVPIQIGMVAGISATFGLHLSEAFLSSLVASTLTGTGATITGRAIVSGLFKLVPGVGTLIGSAISATTAAAVTSAFGEAYIRSLEALFQRRRGEPPTAEELVSTVKEEFKLGHSPRALEAEPKADV